MASNTTKINTPHAAVVVFNYRDRIGSEVTPKEFVSRVDKTIISSLSIESIRTSKSKGEPAGTFEIVLSPTKNWISTLTAGSWLCILLGQRAIQKTDLETANKDLMKMLGRIDSVRASITVDPQTGARRTSYVVSGQDWGSIFYNLLYVDPIIDGKDSAVGAALKMNLNEFLYNKDNSDLFRTSFTMIKAIINFWGMPIKDLNSVALKEGITLSHETSFIMPDELVKFLKLDTKKLSNKVTENISLLGGVLVGDNIYKRVDESVGIIDPTTVYGAHTVWQVMTDNCNTSLNELFCDINWDSDRPKMALYHRIRPFIIRTLYPDIPQKDYELIKKLLSPFKLIKKTSLLIEDVINIDAGTNWRDKYNFVEIRSGFSDAPSINTIIKTAAQVTDRAAFAREGFRPMIATTKQLSLKGVGGGVFGPGIAAWKWLLREWYFDTHRLLNGTVTVVGQDKHIEVGSNILISASVFGGSFNMVKNMNQEESYLLAHVENIAHAFTVTPEGARTFTSTIQFVRGIITDKNGNSIGDNGRLDSDVQDINGSAEYTKSVVTTPTKNNPVGGE